MIRQPIFDAVKAARGGRSFTAPEVAALDAALDALGVPHEGGRQISDKGLALIKKFEGCELNAYPDPGTGGDPWTIGWGATGAGIKKGVTWTQEQADERLRQDAQRFADDVAKAVGDAPTSQDQFDALVAFHYNTGKLPSSTLLKLHKAGDFSNAALEFRKWVHAGGRVLPGLVNRRTAEERLYRGLT